MKEKKQALRGRMKVVREAVAALGDERQALLDNAVEGLRDILGQQQGDILIGGYSPIQTEPDIPAILDRLAAERDFAMCLPRITPDNASISFREYEKGDKLKAHRKFKVLEPLEKASRVRPTILIVPLLAFDQDGGRLGYGGGFYDKAIAQLKIDGNPLITVGIAYDEQRVDRLPRERHDQPLDVIITQSRLLEITQNRSNSR
jgi:5-formyltetrahydrofolate cyclo-ligase